MSNKNNIKFIEIYHYFESEGDPLVDALPFVNTDEYEIRLLIDIETGQIINYPEGIEPHTFHCEIDGDITYTLYDGSMKKIGKTINDRIPNKAIPPFDGDSELLLLEIDENGVITNWYDENNRDFSEFLK